jgi:ATP-dependent Zn protease
VTRDFLLFLSNILAAVTVGLLAYNTYLRHAYRRQLAEITGPKTQFKTAVHEAGHAITVLKTERVKSTLRRVTTVPDEESGGKVQYNLTGLPVFVQWEQVIVALGGAAGEYVGRGEVDTHGCGKDLEDALTMAEAIAAQHAPQVVKNIDVDVQRFYKKKLGHNTRAVLNFCFTEAVKRVESNEGDFYRLVDTLIARRELTGRQVQEVLSRK